MGDRDRQVPQHQFVAAWNGATSPDGAAARVKELARGNVPPWAVMARAIELRKDGVALKRLPGAGRSLRVRTPQPEGRDDLLGRDRLGEV